MNLQHRFLMVQFPGQQEPEWAPRVDRWYQLDAFGYALNHAVHTWIHSHAPIEIPSIIILASPGASNETDGLFTRSGGASPSKFVHTLPNIRGSSLCQMMNWHGPVLCLQKDPETLVTALGEAFDILEHQNHSVVWIASVVRKSEGSYEVHLFAVTRDRTPAYAFEVVKRGLAQRAQDMYFLNWLKNSQGEAIGLPGEYEIRRRKTTEKDFN